VAAGGVGLTLVRTGPAPRDVASLSRALGEEIHGFVRSEDVRWEPSRGAVADLLSGRFALLLGSDVDSGPRDVYRARIRVTPEGRVVGIASVCNLTATPLGDDHSLVVSGSRAAYATLAFGQQQSVTALDLSGEHVQNAARSWRDRVMAALTNWQLTGSIAGIGRLDLVLEQPSRRVGLELVADALGVSLADDDVSTVPTRVARILYETGELATPAPPGMRVEPRHHLPKPFVFWMVDTLRAVSWIGPAPVAWLEEKAFALRDRVRRAVFYTTSSKGSYRRDELADSSEMKSPPAAAVLDGSEAAQDRAHWPPPPIAPRLRAPEAGEGVWTAPSQPWIRKSPLLAGSDPVPSMFYRTFVRPDDQRPYAKVVMVAMDMRQLDLAMEAGSEDPKPLTGSPGPGRLPRDPAVYTRVAAAFNGGFKTEHGSYGMMVNRRVLLPPQPGAATVIVTSDERVGLGSWGNSRDISGIEGVDARAIVSFRQNLDPLIDRGQLNPSHRTQWGFTLPGTSMQTERSGLCVTAAGHLIYAWGDDLSATALATAMGMASCVYGMHLDMNPHHTGFMFTNITDLRARSYKSDLLDKQMGIDTTRFVEYAPKDFFYVMVHDPAPPALAENSDAQRPVATKWEPDPGLQPAPSWSPGLWRLRDHDVELLTIEPGRASYRLRAGMREPDSKTGIGRAHDLAEPDARRVLLAVTLGVSEVKRPHGLAADGRIALAPSAGDGFAALVVSPQGALRLEPAHAVTSVAPHADAAELPLLIESGRLVERHADASRTYAALGFTKANRVYIARVASPVAPRLLADVLLRAGCISAVLLDRGAGERGTVYRAGTPSPPRARYDDSVLYAVGKALVPRAYRFQAEPDAPR